MHTLDDMMRFIMKHKDGKYHKAFPDSQPINIMYSLVTAMKQDTYVYAERENGSICGVVYGELEPDNIWFLHNIIATEKWVLPKFIEILFQKWPNYHIKMERKGKTRILTLEQLKRILNKLK